MSSRGTSPATGSRARRTFALAGVVFVACVVVLLPSSLLGGKVLSGNDLLAGEQPSVDAPPPDLQPPHNPFASDSTYVFRPDLQFARGEIRHGKLPTWTPFTGGGRPLLASQQSAPLYPPNWLVHVSPSFWRSLAYVAALVVLLAALGAFAFARQLQLRTAPALIAGLAWGFGTYQVVWLEHPHSHVYVLLPWALLFVERLARGGHMLNACGLGAVVGSMLLGGHPQSTFIMLLVVAAYAAVRVAGRAGGVLSEPGARPRALLATVAGVCVGILIGAIMWLPFLEALGESEGAGRGGASHPAKVLASLAMPELWGRPDKAETPDGPPNFQERVLYVGALPLLLALVAGFGRRDWRFWTFAGIGLAGLALALEWRFGDVLRDLPLLDQVNLARGLIVAAFALAMLAALGLDALLRGQVRRPLLATISAAALVLVAFAWWADATPNSAGQIRDALGELPGLSRSTDAGLIGSDTALRWLLFGGLGLGALVALGRWPRGTAVAIAVVAAVGLTAEDLPALSRHPDVAVIGSFAALRWLIFGGLAAAVIALLARAPRGRVPVIVVVVAVALTAWDLLSVDRGYHPQIPIAQADAESETIKYLRSLPDQSGRVVSEWVLGPNLSERFGLRDPRAHHHPPIRRYTELWRRLGGFGKERTDLTANIASHSKIPDLYSVKWLFAVVPRPGRFLDGPVFGQTALVRNPHAFPRAWVAHRWQTARNIDESMLLTAQQRTPDPSLETEALFQAPVVERAPAPPAGARGTSKATIVKDGDTEVVIDVLGGAGGQLVLTDTYYPGWKATVDGQEAKIRPANAAFRAVSVPPGRHVVRFSYEPPSVRLGIGLSLAGTLVVAAGALLALRRRRMRAQATPAA